MCILPYVTVWTKISHETCGCGAARLALLRGGVEAVRVEKLARDLRVTKGSFYWHFRDRDELLELLLREWEIEVRELLSQLKPVRREKRMHALLRLVEQRARLSERGAAPSDAAIFAWASVDRIVARRVNIAEAERIELLTRLVGSRDRMELFYLMWLGFVARGQRVPRSRKRFPEIARQLDGLASEARIKRHVLQPAPKTKKYPTKRS